MVFPMAIWVDWHADRDSIFKFFDTDVILIYIIIINLTYIGV